MTDFVFGYNNCSKFIGYLLRHRPDKGNLVLDEQGWADISDLLRAINTHFRAVSTFFNKEDLMRLVATQEKRRYVINEAGDKIRATHGHTVPVDLGIEAATPPRFLYHGTKADVLPRIRSQGLDPRLRQFVHLSVDRETAQVVGDRRKGETVIVTVHTNLSPHEFYQSSDGIWLTEEVPPYALSYA
jgi:putative RNA 2'-phosphotransferase